jgi:uncharacterized membrane protein
MSTQGETPSTIAQTETANGTPIPEHHHHHTTSLFHHELHQHQPRNVNALHKAELAAEGWNTKIAISLTNLVGSMWTAYLFAGIAFIGLLAILGVFSSGIVILVSWVSQTLIQLVLLPVIMVGQNVLGRKAELQSDEQFRTTMSTYHDIEQIMQHLSAQDEELLRHTKILIHLLEKNGISLQQLGAEIAKENHLEAYAEQLAANTPATPAPDEGAK